MTLRALGCPEGCNPWECQALGFARSFFTAGTIASLEPLCHQEAVGCDARRDGETHASLLAAAAYASQNPGVKSTPLEGPR